jgi:hypothetical protein
MIFKFLLEKWFVLAINLYNDGTIGKIQVDFLVAGNSDWEDTFYSEGASKIVFGEEGEIFIGTSFSGIINSLQIEMHSGKLIYNREDAISKINYYAFLYLI